MACVNTLADIEAQCDITTGFKSKLYAAAIADIDTIAPAVDGSVATITMKAAKVFSVIPISTEINENSIVSAFQGNSDGSVYENKLTFFSPGLSGLKNTIIGDLRRPLGYVFIAIDKEGTQHILGAKDDGASVKPGQNNDAKKGYTVEVTHLSKSFPLIYTGIIPKTP